MKRQTLESLNSTLRHHPDLQGFTVTIGSHSDGAVQKFDAFIAEGDCDEDSTWHTRPLHSSARSSDHSSHHQRAQPTPTKPPGLIWYSDQEYFCTGKSNSTYPLTTPGSDQSTILALQGVVFELAEKVENLELREA